LISFLVGKYKDEVMCDVVIMNSTHLLMRCSWQFDRKVRHDGFKNMYCLEKDRKTFTLILLLPKQVYEDQSRLKKEDGAKSSKQPYEDVRKSRNNRSLFI